MIIISWTFHYHWTINVLTHWGWVMHTCVSDLTSIGSDNGLSADQCQAIIWTNTGILLNGPLETNFSGILIEIHTILSKKRHFKMTSGKWRPFCLGLNVVNPWLITIHPRNYAHNSCFVVFWRVNFTHILVRFFLLTLGQWCPNARETTLKNFGKWIWVLIDEYNKTLCIPYGIYWTCFKT